jgi:hypothetical protein
MTPEQSSTIAPEAPKPKRRSPRKKATTTAIGADGTTTTVVEPAAKKRSRTRTFQELFDDVMNQVTTAHACMSVAKRNLKSLQSAHNRAINHTSKQREPTTRTPTIVFDQELVDYFRSRLAPEEMIVKRKTESASFSLADLSTETRVHRTDVTQLYNLVFKKHKMQDAKDRRKIDYKSDPDLVKLLTTGNISATLADDVAKIHSGTYILTIFNIQRFTNHHLGKVAPASDPAPASVATEPSAEAEPPAATV